MITYITSTSAPTPQVNHNSTACTPRPDEMIRYKCTKRDVSLGNFQQSNDKKNTGIKRRRSLFSGVVDGWMDGWLSVWDRLTAGSGGGRGKCNWFRLMAYYVVMPQRYRCRNAEPCTGILFFFPYHRKRID